MSAVTDPGMAAPVLGAAAALLALAAMAWVACIDVRCLEIDPGWAAIAASAGMAALVAVEGPGTFPDAVAASALAGGAAWLAGRLRPAWLGQGDVTLFALVGALSGPQLLVPVLVIGTVFCLATCIAYGLARGKRPSRIFRHMVPAGPSLMAALGPVFAWRLAEAASPDPVPAGAATALAVAGLLALAAALVAGALPMAVRRRATVTNPCGPRGRANQQRRY